VTSHELTYPRTQSVRVRMFGIQVQRSIMWKNIGTTSYVLMQCFSTFCCSGAFWKCLRCSWNPM